MNERIKEFYEQCNRVVDDPFGGAHISFDHQMFAELIVAHAVECVRDVLRNEDSDLTYTAASQVQDCIKQHFGVEE
jgi:hypothetical protein